VDAVTLEHRAADALVWLIVIAALLLGGTCLREPTPLPPAASSEAP